MYLVVFLVFFDWNFDTNIRILNGFEWFLWGDPLLYNYRKPCWLTNLLVVIVSLSNILSVNHALFLKHPLGWYHHSPIYIFYKMNCKSCTDQRRICRDWLHLFLLLLPFSFIYWYFLSLVHNGTCCRNNDFSNLSWVWYLSYSCTCMVHARNYCTIHVQLHAWNGEFQHFLFFTKVQLQSSISLDLLRILYKFYIWILIEDLSRKILQAARFFFKQRISKIWTIRPTAGNICAS